MFGCLAIYVDDRIVLVLRDKQPVDGDVGVWLATTREHHESLKRDFPSMRSISLFGSGVTGWQVLPATELGFEEEALHAVECVRARDPRIGKIPARKKSGVKKGGKKDRTITR